MQRGHTNWTRRGFLRNAALGAAALASPFGISSCASGQPAKAGAKPARNLVFILIDDLGVMDLAIQGSDYYETPNCDRLAKSGMRFTDAYAAHPVCSPTRASLLTGRYPARLKLSAYIPGQLMPHAKLQPPDFIGYMRDAEKTYAEAFRDAGFRTCHVGKWHVSSRSGPAEHGFETVTAQRNGWSDKDFDDPWFVDHYTSALEQFMEQNRDQRFLAVLSHGTVHVPLYEKEELIDKYRGKQPGSNRQSNPTMGAMIERMDWSVGRVLDKLEELGIAEETAVVFTSDNGGLSNVWDQELQKAVIATSNLPWRGGKSQLYEGGIRIPMMIRWPGVTQPGSVEKTPVITTDLYPTFLEICGQELLPGQHLDGLSLAPLLGGSGKLERNNLYFHYPHYQTMPPHSAVRSGDWKLILHYEGDWVELFNLAEDPGEKNNLAKKHPEIAEQLRGYLMRHFAAIGAQLPVANPDHIAGRESEGKSQNDYDPHETRQAEDPRPIVADPDKDAGANWPVPRIQEGSAS